jgi:hypothetical protein
MKSSAHEDTVHLDNILPITLRERNDYRYNGKKIVAL